MAPLLSLHSSSGCSSSTALLRIPTSAPSLLVLAPTASGQEGRAAKGLTVLRRVVLLGRGGRGPRGGRDPRLPGRGCRGPRTRGRSLGGAPRLGCLPSVGRLPEPPLEAGTRSGAPRAMGRGDWCAARAAAAFAASCTRDPRPGGTRRWSREVQPPAPPPSGAAPRRGRACTSRRARARSQGPRARLPSARSRVSQEGLSVPELGPPF